jgi:hypothetical protein
MVKKKNSINWKKWGKKFKKAQRWMGENINQDVLTGNEDKLFVGNMGDSWGDSTDEYFGFDSSKKHHKKRK